ncbi:hypothetical protein [Romboutsia sp.]|uniref:hypothetical protein n=1 Tax=Romboutsia sp. TaxID=1965302 RepID=UPI003F2E5EEA
MNEKILNKTYFWDIETSTIITDCKHEMQVTYLSNVITFDITAGVITESKFFRTISETIEYFLNLPNCIVWSHNLDYEMTFLLRETQGTGATSDFNKMYEKEGQDIILRDKNSPLSITLVEIPNITFRDSYALFNKSVAALGDELGLPKLDYNYKIIRLPWDNLKQIDYDYNERDNVIIALSLDKYMKENDININEVPLTFTSSVRKSRKNFISNNYGSKQLIKYYYDRYNSFTSFDFMDDLMKVYQGGLTTSNIKQTSKLIDNKTTSGVIGLDIKSSYPFQMCTMKYPIFDVDNTQYGHIANEIFLHSNYKGFVGMFKFTNIKVKNLDYLLPISSSQIRKGGISEKYELFNGKLLSADYILIPCTNTDIDVIKLVYNFDTIQCERITTATKEQYLRKEEVAFLLHNFLNKETKEGEVKAKSKLIINSMYGVKVSNPIKDHYEILDGEILTHDYFDYTEEKREEMFNIFLEQQNLYGGSIDVYSHGVYITSYARKQLVEMIVYVVDNGGKVVYSDTDSIKFYCKTKKEQNKLIDNILSMNEIKIKNNKRLPRFKSFKNDFKISDEEYNIITSLGIWEKEDMHPHKLFMTYGAKKYGYITYDDKINTTIAGCNKKNVPKVIKNVASKNNITLEEAFTFVFSPGTTFDVTASGRTIAQKEKLNPLDMINMTYKGRKIKQFGGIVIKDTTYTLNMTLKDSKILGYNETDLEIVKIDIEGDVKFE